MNERETEGGGRERGSEGAGGRERKGGRGRGEREREFIENIFQQKKGRGVRTKMNV